MKHETEELLPSAQTAFENYPQITASPDFNRCVLDRVLCAPPPSRLELFCDRLDEIFARPILKLLGVACLAVLFGLIGTNVLLRVGGVSTSPIVAQSTASPGNELDDTMLFAWQTRNRLAWARGGSTASWGNEALFPPQLPPARREESAPIEDKRRSQCPAAFRSLV